VAREQIKIEGMSCQHCVSSVIKALESLKGIEQLQVDLEQGSATFLRSEAVTLGQIKRVVEDAGYRVVG
jgi:copper chaperone CopZ